MNYLREYGLKLSVIIFVLAALSPSALPQPFITPIIQAGTSLSFGRTEQALKSLGVARQFEPSAQRLHETELLLALDLGAWEEAESHLRALNELEISNSSITCAALELELARNRDLSSDNTTLAACPEVQSALQTLAADLFEAGRYDRALPMLENLIKVGTEGSDEQVKLALYQAATDPTNALDQLRLAQAVQNPGGRLALTLLLAIQDAQGDESAASLSARIGQLFLRQGQWSLAQKSLELAVQEDPTFSQAWGYLGMVKSQLGLDGGSDLARARTLSPNDPLLMILQAAYYNQQAQPEIALAQLEEALTLEPDNPAIATELGQTYVLLGDLESARAAFLQATQLAPDEPSFWILLADFSLQYEIDLNLLALPALRNALILEPDSVRAWRSLGYAYHLQGNYSLAKRALAQAIELSPDDPASQYYLGLLYQEHGLTAEAIAAWTTAGSISPDHPFAILAHRALETVGLYH